MDYYFKAQFRLNILNAFFLALFTYDVTKCKKYYKIFEKKIKGAADKNGLKNVTFKEDLNMKLIKTSLDGSEFCRKNSEVTRI